MSVASEPSSKLPTGLPSPAETMQAGIASEANTASRLISLCKEYGELLSNISDQAVSIATNYCEVPTAASGKEPGQTDRSTKILQARHLALQQRFNQLSFGIQ